jgi:hypothetical protein
MKPTSRSNMTYVSDTIGSGAGSAAFTERETAMIQQPEPQPVKIYLEDLAYSINGTVQDAMLVWQRMVDKGMWVLRPDGLWERRMT